MNNKPEKNTKDTEPMKGHVYDGIEELDNPIPGWFQALFYGTVLFGLAYFFYYQLGDGPSQKSEYEKIKNADDVALHEYRLKTGASQMPSEEELLGLVKNSDLQKSGSETYQSKCASCHGAQGQGGIGPNLTDRYLIHGAKLSQVFATVSKGVPEKGMPSWDALLSLDELKAVTVFVRNLFGTKPAGAKEPQGELIESP